jgi:hypothetical protein
MKRLSVRLAVAFATLATGLLLATPRIKPTLSRVPCEKNEAVNAPQPWAGSVEAPKQSTPQTTLAEAGVPDAKTPHVGQQETMLMPGVGRVRVTAFETEENTRLVFENADTQKELNYFTMAEDSLNPKLRFKVMHVKGLPDPMIVGVSVSPGGSDSTYEMVAVASVGGGLRELSRTDTDTFTTEEEGGFYLGDLGHGVGLGVVVWDFVWGYDESHVSPHQYEIKFYKWNKETARFEWNKVLRTPGKFSSDKAALRSVGLKFKDVRAGIHGLDYSDE